MEIQLNTKKKQYVFTKINSSLECDRFGGFKMFCEELNLTAWSKHLAQTELELQLDEIIEVNKKELDKKYIEVLYCAQSASYEAKQQTGWREEFYYVKNTYLEKAIKKAIKNNYKVAYCDLERCIYFELCDGLQVSFHCNIKIPSSIIKSGYKWNKQKTSLYILSSLVDNYEKLDKKISKEAKK